MKGSGIIVLFISIMVFSSCSKPEKEFWPNGNLKSEIQYKGEQKEGDARYYYEDGTLQMSCTYHKNKLSGLMTRYYTNGFKQEEQYYLNDLPDGPGKTWDRLGLLASTVNYSAGKLHGIYREWHPNQVLKTDGVYVNGLFDGQWLYYNDLGFVIGEGVFTDGTGTLKNHYDNGKIKQVTRYKLNLKEGEEIVYNEDGSVFQIIEYKSGMIIPDQLR